MKRTLSLILVLIMMLSVLSGCSLDDMSGTMVSSSYEGTIAASVTLHNSKPLNYTTFAEAWEFANRNTDLDVVITLRSDIKAENNKFGSYSVLTPAKRTAPLVLDLNGFSIDKGLTSAQNDGAIFSVYNACDFTIKNGTLCGGYNSSVAGCIFVDSADVYLHLENVTIKGNKTSSQGGALFISAAGCVELTDCTVEDNSASDHGGAFFMTGNKSNVILNNTTVQNNSSDKNGGAMFIYGSDSTLTLNDSTFAGNHANLAGGIHWDENDGKMASIVMSGVVDLARNYRYDGEYYMSSNLLISPYPNGTSRLTITDLDNASMIYASFEGDVPNTLVGNFSENLKVASVFHADSSSNVVTVADGIVKLAAADNCVASVIIDNQAVIYSDFDSAWNAANLEDENTVYLTLYQDVNLGTCQSEGKYKKEGALYPGEKDDDYWLVFNLNGHTIDRGISSADDYGMIFYIYNNTNVIIENGTLTGGKSDSQGGAIYCCDDDAYLVLKDMTIKYNYAEKDGSAIYIDDLNSITFEGTTVIEENQVGSKGGKTTSAVNLEDCYIFLRGKITIKNNKGPVTGYDNNLVLRDYVRAGSSIDPDSEIYITNCTTGYSLGYYGTFSDSEKKDGTEAFPAGRYSFRRFTELNWMYGDSLVDWSDIDEEYSSNKELYLLVDIFHFDKDMYDSDYRIAAFRNDGEVGDGCYGFGWIK